MGCPIGIATSRKDPQISFRIFDPLITEGQIARHEWLNYLCS